MRTNTFILLISFFFSLLACGSGEKKGSTLLSGNLQDIEMDNLYLLDLANPNDAPVDTAIIGEDGNFSFTYKPKEISFYRINLRDNLALVLPLEASDSIVVEGSALNPSQIIVKGSKNAERMMEFNHYISKAFSQQQLLNNEYQQYSNHPNKDSIIEVFSNRFQAIETEVEDFVKGLIDEDPALFANLALVEQLEPDKAENIAYLKKVDDALSATYGSSPFYQSFKRTIDEVSKFMPGSPVPEIELPNPDGEMIALSSLRGKVVLIDFWASWCKPCRHENPNVVAAYQKYKDKGFTVFGVSLDRTKDAWVEAIKKDNLTWTHVSDLKFWQSEAAQAYNVTGIPFAVLIDKEGKVIAKNLRGQALHKKLAEILD